jgi:hypothetical protein
MARDSRNLAEYWGVGVMGQMAKEKMNVEHSTLNIEC